MRSYAAIQRSINKVWIRQHTTTIGFPMNAIDDMLNGWLTAVSWISTSIYYRSISSTATVLNEWAPHQPTTRYSTFFQQLIPTQKVKKFLVVMKAPKIRSSKPLNGLYPESVQYISQLYGTSQFLRHSIDSFSVSQRGLITRFANICHTIL